MRRLVIKKTWSNSSLITIAVFIICAVVFYPLFTLLRLVGLSDFHTGMIYTSLTGLTTVTILALKVKREPTKIHLKSAVVWYTAIGFVFFCGGVAMRQIFFACAGALLIIGIWAWGTSFHRYRQKNMKGN